MAVAIDPAAWATYHQDAPPKELSDPRLGFITNFVQYFQRNPQLLADVARTFVLEISYPGAAQYQSASFPIAPVCSELRANSPIEHIGASIHEHPSQTFACIGIAAYQVATCLCHFRHCFTPIW